MDDRLEGEQPDHQEPQEGNEGALDPNYEGTPVEDVEEQSTIPDDNPDGSQYEDEEPSYEEYDGYAPPSDDEEPVYIWAMNDRAGTSGRPTFIQLEDVDWQPC